MKIIKISNFKFQISSEGGTTLIELMAAVSIFTATLIVVATVFMSVVSSQKRSSNAMNVENAAYFAMETISKEIRTGRDFSCRTWSGLDCVEIGYTNYRGEAVWYNITNNRIEKICSSPCSAGSITPSTVNASYLKFILNGTAQPDYMQSRITVVMEIKTLANVPASQQRDIKLQTTISSRSPDS